MLTGVKHFHTHIHKHTCASTCTHKTPTFTISSLPLISEVKRYEPRYLWQHSGWDGQSFSLSLSLLLVRYPHWRKWEEGEEEERERHHSYSVLQASVGFIAHWQQQHPGPCILNRALSSKHTLIRALIRTWNLLISRLFYTLHYYSYNTQTQVYKVSIHLL